MLISMDRCGPAHKGFDKTNNDPRSVASGSALTVRRAQQTADVEGVVRMSAGTIPE